MKKTKLYMRKPLPNKNGLSPSAIWLPKNTKWNFILDFLCEKFCDVSIESWKDRMRLSEVVDENGNAFKPESKYQELTHLFYYRELPYESKVPFLEKIIYQDDFIIVADKPHFLATVPSGKYIQETLLVRLQNKLNIQNIVPIHRLDRETAGLIIFAKQPKYRGAYQSLFAKKLVKKIYQAIAPPIKFKLPLTYSACMQKGHPFFRMQTINAPSNSTTIIDVIEKSKNYWLYQLEPQTGKKHQLRLHMSNLDAPILNDSFYPNLQIEQNCNYNNPLQLLAKQISFIDPISKQKRTFFSTQSLNLNKFTHC